MKFKVELWQESKTRTLATAGKLEDACLIARAFMEHYRGQQGQIWVRLKDRKQHHQMAGHCCDVKYPIDWLKEAGAGYQKWKEERRQAKARMTWLKEHGGFDRHWPRIQSDEAVRAAFFNNRFQDLEKLLLADPPQVAETKI